MIIVYVIVGVILAGLILLRIILVKRGGHSFPWLQFYIRGKEERLHLHEISNLQQLVTRVGLREPLSVYWSKTAIITCIKSLSAQYENSGVLEHMREARFIKKLYNLLNKIMHISKNKKRGLQNTKEMDVQTHIQFIHGTSTYKSQIIEIHPRYLAIAHPRISDPSCPAHFPHGDSLMVKFWKNEDSGYEFKSHFVGANTNKDANILHIQHTRKIMRSQERRLIRKKVNVPGVFFIYKNRKEAFESPQDIHGLKCQVIDISEGGASVIIGGISPPHAIVCIKVVINNVEIMITTRLVGHIHDKERHVSLLRLKTIAQSVVMQNRISSLVYDIHVAE